MEAHQEALEDHPEDLEAAEALMTAAPLTLEPEVAVEATLRRTFLESPETIIPSSPRFLIPLSSVTARPRADTMLTPRLNVRLFMFAQVMAMVASQNTASSVQMEQSSNKSI